jgi:hypothetical protein
MRRSRDRPAATCRTAAVQEAGSACRSRLHPGDGPNASQQTASERWGYTIRLKQTIGIVLLLGSLAVGARADRHAIDVGHSRLLVTVYKSGLFSLFAHNHEIEAPIISGSVATGLSPAVELQIAAANLRVLDPGVAAETREEIHKRMLGPDVLDAARYPLIRFVSRRVQETGRDRWHVEGDLTLHGQTHPLAVDVKMTGSVYTGSVEFRQSDFGITPIRIAAGTVRVKDAVRVRFRILLGNSTSAPHDGDE